MDRKQHSLRIALVWNGTIYQERFFTELDEHVVTIGEHDDNVFSLPAPSLPDSLEAFERHDEGLKFRFTDQTDVTLVLNGEEHSGEELVDIRRAVSVGAARTAEGQTTIYEMDLDFGDWGLIDLGRIQLFFQCLERSSVVAGRKPGQMLDGPLAAMLMVALLLHAGVLVLAFLQPPTPQLETVTAEERWAKFDVDDIEDAADEEEPEEQPGETAGEEAEEPDDAADEPEDELAEESADSDEEVEEELEVDQMGIHEALDSTATFDELLADDTGPELAGVIDNGLDDGERDRGIGADGLRGSGGGDNGHGTVDTIGDAPGGGEGPPTELDAGQELQPPSVDTGHPGVDDFCDPGDIQERIAARSDAIQHCFNRQLQTDPGLSGNLTLDWRVELDGSTSNVQAVESTVDNAEVERCVTMVIERIEFAEPDGGICQIHYPFVFSGLE